MIGACASRPRALACGCHVSPLPAIKRLWALMCVGPHSAARIFARQLGDVRSQSRYAPLRFLARREALHARSCTHIGFGALKTALVHAPPRSLLVNSGSFPSGGPDARHPRKDALARRTHPYAFGCPLKKEGCVRMSLQLNPSLP